MSSSGTKSRHGHALRIGLLLVGLLLLPSGCKRSDEGKPKPAPQAQPAKPQPSNAAAQENKPAASSPSEASTTQPAPSDTASTDSGATSSPATTAKVCSDSPFFPKGDIVKVSLDSLVLTDDQAYAALMPALVKFLDSAAETSYPQGTPVMRPAIHLDTATDRTSYMLVPGEPAVRCYLPDKVYPWLFGDDKAYDELITALERLYGRKLPRG